MSEFLTGVALSLQMSGDRKLWGYPFHKLAAETDRSYKATPAEMLEVAKNVLTEDPSTFWYLGRFSQVFWYGFYAGYKGPNGEPPMPLTERAKVYRDAHVKMEQNALERARNAKGLKKIEWLLQAHSDRRSIMSYNRRIARLER